MHPIRRTEFLNVLLLSCSIISTAYSHGMMCDPRQRAAYKSSKCGSDLRTPPNPVIDYCAHCLNGGGTGTVKSNLPPKGWKLYEPLKDIDSFGDRAGMCGDPKGNNDHMIGGRFMPYDSLPIVNNYKSGSVVDFTAEIDTNHNGYFDFYLCNMDKCSTSDLSTECFKENACYKLERVPHPDCENPSEKTHTECGPIDPKYPGRWYLPCRKTAHVGIHIVGGSSGTMRYQLPSGVECKHCIIQWYWATANSCAPRGFLEYMEAMKNPFGTTCPSDGGGRGAYRENMQKCHDGGRTPEEFWSCADVQVTGDRQSAGPVVPIETNDGNAANDEDQYVSKTPSPSPTMSESAAILPSPPPSHDPTPSTDSSMPSPREEDIDEVLPMLTPSLTPVAIATPSSAPTRNSKYPTPLHQNRKRCARKWNFCEEKHRGGSKLLCCTRGWKCRRYGRHGIKFCLPPRTRFVRVNRCSRKWRKCSSRSRSRRCCRGLRCVYFHYNGRRVGRCISV